jgi:hypothetical protein
MVSSADPVAAFNDKRFDDAAQLFALQARSGGKDAYKAWFNAGASYWNVGNQTKALEAYEQAAYVNPLYIKAHIRLTNKYAGIEQQELSVQHKTRAQAIQQVTKLMLPLWDKANQLRGRGADYDYAAAYIHEACATYYEQKQLPDLASAERKLAAQNRTNAQAANAKYGAADRDARIEADDRAFRAEVIGTLKDLTATVTNVNPISPFAPDTGGSAGARSTVMGLGAVEQSLGTYANTMQMFEPQLQAQRESVRQQGQQAQLALADPSQAQLQREAQQRTIKLQKRLEEMEKQAAEYLLAEGILDESEALTDRDTLDQ